MGTPLSRTGLLFALAGVIAVAVSLNLRSLPSSPLAIQLLASNEQPQAEVAAAITHAAVPGPVRAADPAVTEIRPDPARPFNLTDF